MRKASVEIDAFQGTEPPPERVRHRNEDHTLVDIFRAAGMELELVPGRTGLALPKSGRVFDLVALHAAMRRNVKKKPKGWHAHVLVVPRIEYMAAYRKVEPLGVMYDFRSNDQNGVPREGCAMSHEQVAHEPRGYLRTLAHELGHVFNLLHPKDENPPLPIGTSVMNQTADLQQLGAFPDNIEYAFSPGDARWFAEAPSEYVRPGGLPFGSRPEDLAALAGDAVLSKTPGLALEVSTARDEYVLGEPIHVRLTLRNVGQVPIVVPGVLSPFAGTVEIHIVGPANREVPFRPVWFECIEPGVLTLPPGGVLRDSIPVFLAADRLPFASPGRYAIRAVHRTRLGNEVVAAFSRRHEIEVVAEAGLQGDVSDPLGSPSTALYILLRGGDHLGVEDVVRDLAERHPREPFAQHAKLALAAEALSSRGDGRDFAAAEDVLADVREEHLDLEQRAERARLAALVARGRGDVAAEDRAMGELRERAERLTPEAAEVVERTRGWIDQVSRD